MPVELAVVPVLRGYHYDWRIPTDEVSDVRRARFGDSTGIGGSLLEKLAMSCLFVCLILERRRLSLKDM